MRNRLLESSYLARYLLLNAVGIEDHLVFPAREIANAGPVFHFNPPKDPEALVPVLDAVAALHAGPRSPETMDHYQERNETVAFLVIQHDRLIFERYYNGYRRDSTCTSFSVAKSFVSALVGIALHEKLIEELDDPLTRYLPELNGRGLGSITIRHLISMSSGLAYDRAGSFPWNDQPRIYYSLDLRAVGRGARAVEPPGRRFHYNNYNLLLLGMVLERVTGRHVSEYLQERIWKPLGMEWPGSWSMDSQRSGMEKMESGLNARAVDFAKFGRLYLRRGQWEGRQLIPEQWVTESTTPCEDGRWSNYGYFWWIPKAGKGRFMAIGSLGQFLYVAPDKDCLILRFGRGKPRDWQTQYVAMFGEIAERMIK